MSLLALMGCFQGGMKGKMQLGSAWWFNDQKDGMEAQLKAYASVGILGNFVGMGLISNFVGMLTDSRSFLSYPRHDYFRRILCSFIADLVNEGLYPENLEFIGKVIKDICYNNALNYFNF